MDKQVICRNFSRASGSYNEYARVQWLCAMELAAMLRDLGFSPDSVLDLGAGTGFLSKLLNDAFPDSSFTLNDLSGDMLSQVDMCGRTRFLVGDLETMAFDRHDLIVSNMALQWSEDIAYVIDKFRALSRIFAFSTVVAGTFEEWRALMGLEGSPFVTASKLRLVSGDPISFRLKAFTRSCSDFRDLLTYFKRVGINHAEGAGGRVPKMVRDHCGVIDLTYEVAFVVLCNDCV